MNILREGKVIGTADARGNAFSQDHGKLLVRFYPGEEITEIQLRALFGTATIDILEKVDGTGCYEKVRSCLISGWEVFV